MKSRICYNISLVQNIEQAYRLYSGVEWHLPCSMRSKWRHRAGKSALQSIRMPLALLDGLHEERFARGPMPSNEAYQLLPLQDQPRSPAAPLCKTQPENHRPHQTLLQSLVFNVCEDGAAKMTEPSTVVLHFHSFRP